MAEIILIARQSRNLTQGNDCFELRTAVFDEDGEVPAASATSAEDSAVERILDRRIHDELAVAAHHLKQARPELVGGGGLGGHS